MISRLWVPSLAAVALASGTPAGDGPPARPLAPDVRVCAGGDVSLGTNLDTTWAVRASRLARARIVALPDPAALLAPLAPLFRDADVVLVNVEGAIGEGPARSKCAPDAHDCFALRQPVRAAAALRTLRAGAAVVGNVANNHARDAGVAGLAATVRHLEEAGVAVTGTDTLATPVVTAQGDTVGVLGFGTSGGPDTRDLRAVRRHVARAAARWPRLIVTMHLGAEGSSAQRTRDTMELYAGERRGNPVAFAQAAVESGAKLVVGHGPHVVRGMEWWGDAFVAYSLGNLVTYGPFAMHEPLSRGAVLCATLTPDGRVTHAVLRPTVQRAPGLAFPDRSARAIRLADSLSRLDFPRTAPRTIIEGELLRRP